MSNTRDFNNLLDKFITLQKKFDILNNWVVHKYADDPEMLVLQKLLSLDSIELDHGTIDSVKIDAEVHTNTSIKFEENQMPLTETLHIMKPCVVKLEKLIINHHRFPDQVLTPTNTKPNINNDKHKVKRFNCKECDKNFYTSNYLKIHKRIHTGEKPYSCDICLKSFRQTQHLKNHKISHEDPEIKLYKCEICNKNFRSPNSLRFHKRVHTGVKPFECEICKKRFTYKTNMNSNIRIHSNNTAYNCNFCEKGFRCKITLDRHLLTHTGEKPFGCLTCNVFFCTKSKLNAHNQTHSVTQ